MIKFKKGDRVITTNLSTYWERHEAGTVCENSIMPWVYFEDAHPVRPGAPNFSIPSQHAAVVYQDDLELVDPSESVRIEANNLDDAGMHRGAVMLDRHGALLSRLNSPLSDEEVEAAARAIYAHVFTISIPRMGIKTATFEEVWGVPPERGRMQAQARATLETYRHKLLEVLK